ncbi:hypothetical protein [uncultured Dokdonia sp.]|uniref:hypothetical protein n=1 Tax=uncultured Dokdonia sp. TaxID=575653 RepID=UPI00261FEC9E|nr:hypothetical protein [uncultured Dokdonia sp.]
MLSRNDLNTTSRFSIVAPLSSVSKRTRLYKLAIFLYENGVKSIEHVGWERIEGERKETELPFVIGKKIVQTGGGYGGSKIKLMYFTWMIKLFFKSFSFKEGQTVWALGFESAFPLLLASKIKGFKLYFDDADRFSMLFNFPKPAKLLMQFCEKVTSRNVYKHVIPVQERYDFNSSKFYILQNTPSASEIEKAKEITKTKDWIKASVVININGWLGAGRGMKTALDVCNTLEGKDIAFILVGKLDCPEAKELAQKDNVQYLGEVSNADALSSYLASDFVFTYYNPSSIINTLAASNKWGDAIKTGIGVIVNNEVITANYLHEAGASVSFPYDNVVDLSSSISEYISDPSKIEEIKKNSKNISEEFGYFEEQLEKLLYEN